MPRDEVDAVRQARRRYGDELLTNPDVHGVGVGLRRRAGAKTDQHAIVVHVLRKLSEGDVPPERLVPHELRVQAPDGSEQVVRVDVQERPRPVPESAPAVSTADVRKRLRPAPGGASAGFSGTLGAWVWDTVTEQPVALSNRHVFGSVAGTPIPQPSADDGGSSTADRIGSVVRAATLDASIVAPIDPRDVSVAIAGGAVPVGIADAVIGMRVQKTGRTTGLTRGVVDLVDFHSGHFGAQADLWIEAEDGNFSEGGDSGAVYFDPAARTLVGLHWGGAEADGVGHPIRAVFEQLRLTVLDASR